MTGFRALAGASLVRLRWDEVSWDSEDWVDGPEFIVGRLTEEQVFIDGNGIRALVPFREIYRGPSQVTAYTDRDVVNGEVYFYSLRVEGITWATGFNTANGTYTIHLPVHGWHRGSGAEQALVSAQPTPPRRVRVAV
ncbi:MAG: hypothetical protein KAI66_27740, partial [Lentisphaeria bacterium]|nr:hypothetical protein [Lentisphaeria bacterium]